MTKNKIKTIIMVVAILLCLVLAGGWIAQTVVNKQKQKGEEAGETFIVTPQNTSKSMRLMTAPYSGTSAISNACTVTAKTEHYDGEIRWSMAWAGEEVFWNDAERTESISDCIKLTVQNSRTVLVQCLQPFGRQIKITATLAENSSVSDCCICNYKQSYALNELQIGFNTFNPDGSLGLGLIVLNGIAPASVMLNDSQTLDYSYELVSTSYTIENSAAKRYPSVYFTITPDYEIINKFGLGDFYFMEYTGTFESSTAGSINGFFNREWLEYTVIGTGYTVEDFASMLIAAENGLGFGIDSEPIYTLTIYGLTEDCSYGYYIDIYDLKEAVKGLASVTLDNHEITFGGE